MSADDQTPAAEDQFIAKIPVHVGSGVKAPLVILATLAVLAAFDYAESLILPVVLAFVISLTLTPINLWLQRRIWPGLSAFILVSAVTLALAIAALTLAQPIASYINDAPSIGRELKARLAQLREPVATITEASKEVEEITKATSDPMVREVVMRQPGLLNRAASNIGNIASTLVVAIALTYFLLVTNRLIYEKIVHASPKLSDKKRSLMVVNNIVTTVSKYLLTITVINAGFGLSIACVMFLLGMPSPALWGLAAFLLNYLPFVGSLVGTGSGVLIGLLTYQDPIWAIAPGLAYFAITTIEGHFITPSVLGQRLELNPVAILLSIALWGFIWGVAGVILAVPILIIVKVMSDNIPEMQLFGTFLSGATNLAEEEDAKPEMEIPRLP
ncbi:AI-2E family transporter [Acuticoccus sp. I52.16.1]|uniref:AI-2E family transporter n=1 Tax=Acuticoccus sp. I52.16.1 TaxID=2928472 RepID=UPI001FD139C3|nr:AI-2E family transporter [Acuticoccus sp. I52.16.1]UOM34492.1 AI-2E family transporter [Acuticoccus sp. I52.16.1]